MSTSPRTCAPAISTIRPVPLWVQGVITGGALATWALTAGLFALLSVHPGDGSFNFLKVPFVCASAIAVGAILYAYLPAASAGPRPVRHVVADETVVPLELVWSTPDQPARAAAHY